MQLLLQTTWFSSLSFWLDVNPRNSAPRPPAG
jgi:hypothetical protein